MASTCVAGPAGQTDLPRLLLVSDARHGAAQAALGWGALPHSCWERLKMGDMGGLLSLPGLQWKGNDACRGEEGKRSSLSGACIVHAHLYSALGLSLAERLTPLMRHGVKNGEVQKGVPPRGTSTVLCSLTKRDSTFVQDDPNFSFKRCMKF